MARFLFPCLYKSGAGRRGEIRKRYCEGQEDQLSALGLVVNVIVLWNTLYMEEVLNHLRSKGEEVKDSDVSRLWPLSFEHLNFLGRYFFCDTRGGHQGTDETSEKSG